MHQNDQTIDQFLAFARLQGVNIDPERLEADGRIHRADVGDMPSGKNDAGYLLRPDGTGWITNFKADGKPVQFRPELARELTPEETARIEDQREAWRRQQAERQAVAVEEAIQRWGDSHEPKAFPYLQAPKLDPAGLRQGRAQLLVPMMAIDADGEPGWVGMQRIVWAAPGQSADKRFVAGTPTKGAFAVIPIDGQDVEAPLRAYEAACKADQVVFCEGIGTALAIHQATGLPVIAAMSAQNLPDVARSLHDKLQGRAVIYADNDGERAAHKGQINALKAARILGGARAAIALPEKPNGVTPPGYDARDQLRDSGADAIRSTLDRAVPPWTFQRSHPGFAQSTGQERQPSPLTSQLMQEKHMADQPNKDLTSWRSATRIDAFRKAEPGSLAPEQIESGLTDRHSHVRAAAARHALAPTVNPPSATQIERGLTDKNPDVRAAWAMSPRAEMNVAQIERALTDDDSFVRRVALGRDGAQINAQQAERALTDHDKLVRRDAIARGLPLSPEQIERALIDKEPEVRLAVLGRADIKLTPEQGRRAMEDKHNWVRAVAVERADVRPNTADRLQALEEGNHHLAHKIEDRFEQEKKALTVPAAAIDPDLIAALSDDPSPAPKHFEIDADLLAALGDDPSLPLPPAIEPVTLRPGDRVVADLKAVRPTETGQDAALMQAGIRSLQVTREDGKNLPAEMKALTGQRVEYSIGGDSKDQVRSVPVTIDPALLRALNDDPADIAPTQTVQVEAQSKPEQNPSFVDLDAQIKDAAKLYNDLARSSDATPEQKKAAREQIAALKKEHDRQKTEQGMADFQAKFEAAKPGLASSESRAPEMSVQAEQAEQAAGQEASAQVSPFDALNQALEDTEAQPVVAQSAAGSRTGRPDDQDRADPPEERLLREYAALAEPVRAQRAKSQYDLDAKHQEQREALFGSLDQLRADKTRELSGMAEEHQRSLIALDVAKAIEAVQKQQMSERRSLQSELPDVPSFRNFLEDRAANDPVAARMLDEERARAQIPEAVKGKRVAPVEPAVLEGLTHEIEDGPGGKAIHYARDGERVMSDRGERVDLYKLDDREIEAALRLAAQKYDMDKGLVLTGSREFQQRAAEVAGRMGMKIQNDDLRKAWEQGRLTALQAEEVEHHVAAAMMNGTAGPLDGIARLKPAEPEAARAQRDLGAATIYPVDQAFLAAESVLAHLPSQGWDALSAAGQGHPLTPEQKAWLEDPERPVLVDEQDKLTELGQLAYDRMQARAEDEYEMLQQQLRTRNVDEELEKRDRAKTLEQQTTEHKEEAALARDAAEGLQRADDLNADSAVPQQEVEEQQIKVPEHVLSSRSHRHRRDMGRGM